MSEVKLVLLGTRGGPRITAGGAWPTSSILVVSGRPYLVDAGLGVTRQFVEAGFSLEDLHTVIITHHHSDHNLELGALLHTAWVSSPPRPINVFGPPGLRELIDAFLMSQAFDIEIRVADEQLSDFRKMMACREFREGVVFEDDLVRVSALRVPHPPIHHCYALKFETDAKTIVFSSDTAFCPPLAEFSRGANLLLHEAMHVEGARRMCRGLAATKPKLLEHLLAAHTSCEDVGRIATRAKVEHLVLNHLVPADDKGVGRREFYESVRQTWSGRLTVGRDLLVIHV